MQPPWADLETTFPGIASKCEPGKGVFLGLGMFAMQDPRLVYLWNSEVRPVDLPGMPIYLKPCGGSPRWFQDNQCVLWQFTSRAVAGFVTRQGRNVLVYPYRKLRDEVIQSCIDTVQGCPEYSGHAEVSRAIRLDYGSRTPMVLFPKDFSEEEWKLPKRRDQIAPEGTFIPPPKL